MTKLFMYVLLISKNPLKNLMVICTSLLYAAKLTGILLYFSSALVPARYRAVDKLTGRSILESSYSSLNRTGGGPFMGRLILRVMNQLERPLSKFSTFVYRGNSHRRKNGD